MGCEYSIFRGSENFAFGLFTRHHHIHVTHVQSFMIYPYGSSGEQLTPSWYEIFFWTLYNRGSAPGASNSGLSLALHPFLIKVLCSGEYIGALCFPELEPRCDCRLICLSLESLATFRIHTWHVCESVTSLYRAGLPWCIYPYSLFSPPSFSLSLHDVAYQCSIAIPIPFSRSMNNNLVCGCKLINECAGLRLLRILFSLFRLFFLLPLTGDTDKLGWWCENKQQQSYLDWHPTWKGY